MMGLTGVGFFVTLFGSSFKVFLYVFALNSTAIFIVAFSKAAGASVCSISQSSRPQHSHIGTDHAGVVEFGLHAGLKIQWPVRALRVRIPPSVRCLDGGIWQTRLAKNQVALRSYRFKSCSGHRRNIPRNIFVDNRHVAARSSLKTETYRQLRLGINCGRASRQLATASGLNPDEEKSLTGSTPVPSADGRARKSIYLRGGVRAKLWSYLRGMKEEKVKV